MNKRSDPELVLCSPAKLNLFLHITGRRRDGYHRLQTLFQLLDYGDTMRFIATDGPGITLHTDCRAIDSEDNLVLRAARALQVLGGAGRGAVIGLDKRLPVGGGLGGGSSNAATTLLALNRLWSLGLSPDGLAEVGLTLGADVPVFLRGRTAWAEGVGEILTPMDLPERWYVVLTPPCRVSTREIFSHGQLTRNTSPIKIPAFPIRGGKNDCEQVACLLYPEIRAALDWLNQHGRAGMTGTGGSIFAGFESEQQARAVLCRKPASLGGFVARGVNLSPVHAALEHSG